MSTSIVTPAALEPVSRDEIKARLRLDASDEDALIDALISASRARIERRLSTALISRRLVERRDTWPARHDQLVVLSVWPVIQVHAVRVRGADDVAAVLDPEAYFADTTASPARLMARDLAGWPQPDGPFGGIEIEYDAGYGANASDAPADLREAISLLTVDAFVNRAPSERPQEASWPLAVQALLAPYHRVSA